MAIMILYCVRPVWPCLFAELQSWLGNAQAMKCILLQVAQIARKCTRFLYALCDKFCRWTEVLLEKTAKKEMMDNRIDIFCCKYVYSYLGNYELLK
jgi:hypothetical protein